MYSIALFYISLIYIFKIRINKNSQGAPLRVEHQWRYFFDLNKAILKEHDMFRSKPNVVSVCGGICRALPFAK